MKRQLWMAAMLAGGVIGCGFGDDPNVVARAAGHELSVERLAEIVAQGKAVVLEEDVIDRVAGLWVDYALFAQRIADGDSLLDSATVVEALWGDVRQAIVDDFHDQLLAERASLTGGMVDSAYVAGDHRVIYHILFRTPADMSPPEKAAQKTKAERLRQRVAAGRIPWDQANEQNEDVNVKSSGGSLGLLSRGATVAPFEQVAFGLAPGEISAVTETAYGYHIIRRPKLEDVRDEFEEQLEGLMIQQLDSLFLTDLETRWEVAVNEEAPALMREVAEDLRGATGSRKVVGTYRGGKFTVDDFARWLKTFDVRIQAQVSRAPDEQLTEFARALLRNHVLVFEAEEAGHTLDEDDLVALKERLADGLSALRAEIGLDSALAQAEDGAAQFRVVDERIGDYMAAVVSNRKNLLTVPPFLADQLRREGDWKVSSAGVTRVVERAGVLRAEAAAPAPAPVAPMPPPTADSVPQSEK